MTVVDARSVLGESVECPDCQGEGFGFTPAYWICRRCAGWGTISPRGEALYAAAAELAEHANEAPPFVDTEVPA